MSADAATLAEEVREILFPDDPQGSFDPISRWGDLGRLLESLEQRGCYLMTNTVSDPDVRRMASFHRSTDRGFPCVGASGWGPYESLGEAVLVAARAALSDPEAE